MAPIGQPGQPVSGHHIAYTPQPGFPAASSAPTAEEEEQNRNGLIAVVVVVGLLALLACAGVIGYIWSQGA